MAVKLGRTCAAILGMSALLAVAGCPVDSTSDTTTRAIPVATGRSSSGDGSGLAGPPAATGNAAAASGDPTNASGTSSSALANPDALSITFPDCDRPLETDFWRTEILQLVNQARAAQNLTTVTWSDTLANQAEEYACELIHYDFFDHVNPTTGSRLRDRAAQFGYDFWIIGENLAAGQQSPVEAVQAWLDSPCHRENILNPAFTELGVAVRFGGDYGYYWVQEFGRPFATDPYPGPQYKDPECNE